MPFYDKHTSKIKLLQYMCFQQAMDETVQRILKIRREQNDIPFCINLTILYTEGLNMLEFGRH